MTSYSISSAPTRTLSPTSVTRHAISDGYDIIVIFHSIEGLPMINIVGYTSFYFMATVDYQILFTSTVLPTTSILKWNKEEWVVRNVPVNAKLVISIFNKDDEKPVDNYMGEFEIVDIINYHAPLNGHVIADSSGRQNGRFHLSIQSTKSSNETHQLPHYTFDGPCRYSRHDSLNDDYIYSAWTIQLRRISFFFPPDGHQHYEGARELFGNKVAHKRTVQRNEKGRLTSRDDLWKLIFMDRATQQIKPRIYTYIIDDNTWQFTETGHKFFGDSMRKHAVLTDCSKCVQYAGEFHLRPKLGWTRLDDEWELVFDNASGTYSPNADLLINLKKLFLFNFPGLNVITYDYKDPMLKESIEQMELVAKKYRYNTTTTKSKHVLPHPSFT